jgi:ABC-type transporter Mla subunit MlaD
MRLNSEAKVGLLIMVSFTAFILIIALLAKINVQAKGYKLGIYYGFLNEKTEVIVWIDNKYRLIRDTRFAIFTKGLIGSKYINVFIPPSRNNENFYEDGDKVYGIDPPSFDQMMLIFQSFMNDQSGGEMLADIFINSRNFVENLNKITRENRGDIRTSVLATRSTILLFSQQMKIFMDELNRFTTNMSSLSEKNKEEINIAIKNISEISSNLNRIIQRLEQGRGSLGKLMTDEEVYYNIKDASVSAKELFNSLKQDPSKLFFRQK